MSRPVGNAWYRSSFEMVIGHGNASTRESVMALQRQCKQAHGNRSWHCNGNASKHTAIGHGIVTAMQAHGNRSRHCKHQLYRAILGGTCACQDPSVMLATLVFEALRKNDPSVMKDLSARQMVIDRGIAMAMQAKHSVIGQAIASKQTVIGRGIGQCKQAHGNRSWHWHGNASTR
jgi:hypothetical protein